MSSIILKNQRYTTIILSFASITNKFLAFIIFSKNRLEEGYCHDFIEVYDGPSVGLQYIGKVCDNNQTSLLSSSNSMTVVFRTDNGGVAKGFTADFLSTGTIVGGWRADMTSVKVFFFNQLSVKFLCQANLVPVTTMHDIYWSL